MIRVKFDMFVEHGVILGSIQISDRQLNSAVSSAVCFGTLAHSLLETSHQLGYKHCVLNMEAKESQ